MTMRLFRFTPPLNMPLSLIQPSLKTIFTVIYLYLCICNTATAEVKQLNYHIINQFSHDPKLFTQGLAFNKDLLYESSGLYGQSYLLIRQLEKLQPIQQQPLADTFFAEGLTLHNNKLYQLTWKAGIANVYDANNLALLEQHRYKGQGWGLCSNGQQLIMSNGSSQLQFFSANHFQKQKAMTVTEAGKPLRLLNELEWVEGKIYANIWRSKRIVIINPENGRVEASINLAKLYPQNGQNLDENVLNGIAYDAINKRLFVTGKRWPTLYEIRIQSQ